MLFNKGDHVSFLNENQKGIVKEVLTNNKIIVEIEDGFEIEVYARELVKRTTPTESKPKLEQEKQIEEKSAVLQPEWLCPDKTACFISLPSSGNNIITGDIKYFVSNKTQFDLLYTFFAIQAGKSTGIGYGIIKSMANELILNIKKEELIEFEQFRFESIIYHKSEVPIINHIKKDLPILIPDIKSAEKTIDGQLTFGKKIVLLDNRFAEPDQIKDLVFKYKTKKYPSVKESEKKSKSIYQPEDYGIYINEKVIDLHIEELQNNISGLTNSEMLHIQLQKFNSEMNIAINSNYKKIVFIHGVGNGVLKNAIRQELKHYKGIQVKDGDPGKFGSGATEVIF